MEDQTTKEALPEFPPDLHNEFLVPTSREWSVQYLREEHIKEMRVFHYRPGCSDIVASPEKVAAFIWYRGINACVYYGPELPLGEG